MARLDKALGHWWQARTAGERRLLIALALIVAAALYLQFLYSAGLARERLRRSVRVLQTERALLEQQAAEYRRLQAAPTVPPAGGDLGALLRSQATAAGLSDAALRIGNGNAEEINLTFNDILFRDWLTWVEHLRPLHIRLRACRLEAAARPGRVNGSATLIRASSP